MSKFQILLLFIFGIAIVAAVAIFSLYKGSSGTAVTVTVWGDIPARDFYVLMNNPIFQNNQNLSITYVEKRTDTIEAEFTEALARSTGPDLVILTQDKLWKNRPKLLLIPPNSLSERNFKNTFVEEGELFLDPSGTYALPLTIDPLVLYYNRDKLSSAGIAKPFSYWDEIYVLAGTLSKKDAAGNLTSSVMALGEARNIPRAKDILSLLMLQAGTPITRVFGSDLRSEVASNFGLSISPGESALDFYTQFSNPSRSYYSWNRSLMDAQTHFAAGDSAYYIGYASEFKVIRAKNPNLNFGVSIVPQSRTSDRVTTYGQVRGVAISRGSRNPSAALSAATLLTSRESALSLSSILYLPPPRRDLLAERPADAVMSVFYDAALQARGWLDPDSSQTEAIFREAIESVTGGRSRTSEAIVRVHRELENLLR